MGQRMRAAREQAGLSQEAAAHHVGCATRSVTRWETGRCDPGIATVLLLTELYSVSLNWLLRGCEAPGAGGTAWRSHEH